MNHFILFTYLLFNNCVNTARDIIIIQYAMKFTQG